jgi:hypothetical protein
MPIYILLALLNYKTQSNDELAILFGWDVPRWQIISCRSNASLAFNAKEDLQIFSCRG